MRKWSTRKKSKNRKEKKKLKWLSVKDEALRLARYFGMSVEFWTGIQTHYEVEKAKMELADRLDDEVKVFSPA